MPSLRIVIAGALAAIAVVSAAGGASAQSSAQPGKPMALLAGLNPPLGTQAKASHKAAVKTVKRFAAKRLAVATRTPAPKVVAAAEPADPPAQTDGLPQNILPAVAQPAAESAAAQPAPDPASAADEQGALVVNGQTVQIASPDDVNEIDLAADETMPAASTPTQGLSAEEAPVVVASAAQDDANPVGSASWIAQILAALGGAIAAGSVAWFLIGSGPVRTYDEA